MFARKRIVPLMVAPLIALLGYTLDLPFPVPAFLLGERRYLALDSGASLDGLEALARSRHGAWVSLPEGLERLPRAKAMGELEDLLSRLPARGAIEPIIADIGSRSPWARIRVEGNFLPSPEERAALELAAQARGCPLRFVRIGLNRTRPFMAAARELGPRGAAVRLELILGPDAAAFTEFRVEQGGRVLAQARRPDLPADGVLRLVARPEAGRLNLVAEPLEADLPRFEHGYALGRPGEDEARVLVASERVGLSGALESLYRTDRIPPEALGDTDLARYELIVLDGVPLASLDARSANRLAETIEGRRSSLLAVGDSAAFGSLGVAPRLEALLPVVLRPRSLERLPELAVLVLLDASGSMFGDKLSLAKVSGLELLRNLKPRDLVGLTLFTDRRRVVYDFAPSEETEAARDLEPVGAEGGTDLAAALAEGLDRLEDFSHLGRHVVIVSDGLTRPADFASLGERAAAAGVSISTMSIGEKANTALLASLAARTGGRAWQVDDPEEIPSLLFKDRAAIARSSFLAESTPIFAVDGGEVGSVEGMTQFAPKEGAAVLLSNALGDPLLASMESGSRGSVFFASDLYGAWTSAFWRSPRAIATVRARLDSVFVERPTSVRIVEDERGLSVLARGDLLVAPSAAASDAGGASATVPMRRAAPGLFIARLSLSRAGEYTLLIQDGGETLARYPLETLGGFSGPTAEAELAAREARSAFFALPKSPGAWLGLFFAASLLASLALRSLR